MLTLRQLMLFTALALVAAMLAVVAHDLRCASQLTRMLSRAHPARAVRAAVKESAKAQEPSPETRQAHSIVRPPIRVNQAATKTMTRAKGAQRNCNSIPPSAGS